MIRATCPHCERILEFPDDRAGMEVRCAACDQPLTVGGPEAEYVPEADSRFEPVLHPPRATGV